MRRSKSSKISHLAALRLGGSPPLVGFFSTLIFSTLIFSTLILKDDSDRPYFSWRV